VNDYDDLNDEMKLNSLSDRNRNIGLANGTDSQLSGQLMLLCTVFLTAAIVVVGDNRSIVSSTVTKVLVLQVLVLTFASIACGIKNYFVTMEFYGKWAKQSHKNYQLFIEGNYKDQADLISKFNENLDVLKQESDTFWLRMQILALATAVVLFLAAVALILF